MQFSIFNTQIMAEKGEGGFVLQFGSVVIDTAFAKGACLDGHPDSRWKAKLTRHHTNTSREYALTAFGYTAIAGLSWGHKRLCEGGNVFVER